MIVIPTVSYPRRTEDDPLFRDQMATRSPHEVKKEGDNETRATRFKGGDPPPGGACAVIRSRITDDHIHFLNLPFYTRDELQSRRAPLSTRRTC